MRAIFIDAHAETVEEIDFTGDFRAIQQKLGVDLFTCVTLNDQDDTLYIDDEGLINGTKVAFMLAGHSQPYFGNGLILGTDPDGESTDAKLDAKELGNVAFARRIR